MPIQAPKGTYDMLPDEVCRWDAFKKTAFDIFSRSGYEPIETPMFEMTDLFVRGIGEATDVVSKEMFSVLSGDNLTTLLGGGKVKGTSRFSLRPEGTASVVRAIAQHGLITPGGAPIKLMYSGPMFRAENVQKGRQRQFNQVGVECLGADDPSIDAEAIIMLMRFYDELGLAGETLQLLINSMGCQNCRPAYRELLRDYLISHKDGLCTDCKNRIDANPLRAFDCKKDVCRQVMSKAPHLSDHLCEGCAQHYEQVKAYLDAASISYREDPSLVRGLDYYTRTVFEVQVLEGLGAQNAIGGGGRYDKLMREVGGPDVSGFGFALGYERCCLALDAQGIVPEKIGGLDCYLACVSDEVRPRVFLLAQQLRDAGFAVDFDHQSRSLKSQFKMAGKRNVSYVLVLGPDELEQGIVTCRIMDAHEEVSLSLSALSDTLARLKQDGDTIAFASLLEAK